MQPLLYRTMQKMAMTVAVLLWFMVSYAQKAPLAFLERYDLSTTVINPDTAPTDGIYSWWTESAKKEWASYGNEPMADVWLHRPEPLGFRGADFQRFYIHFDTVYKLSPMVYRVEARSRCKDEIYNVTGRIVIDSVVPWYDEWYTVDSFIQVTESGSIYAHYEMAASVDSKPVARLFGCSRYWYLEHNDSVYYDAMEMSADGYENNQYTGKWVWLSTGDTLTCNWGDFRIPESGKLDMGCGLFIPDEKYYDFDWKPYLDADRHGWEDDPNNQYYIFLSILDMNWWKYHEAKPSDTAPTVPGHYIYAHAFNYDLQGNHLDVHETGTMDFHADGSALDSARQVHEVTLKEGGTVTLVFNYISPSRWRLDGSDFFFSGIKEDFRMEVTETILNGCDDDRAVELAKEIVKTVGGSIDYEYKFHLDTLTAHKLQWSFLYRDGHTDTWEFYR